MEHGISTNICDQASKTGGYTTHCPDCELDNAGQGKLTCTCNDEVTGDPEDGYIYYELGKKALKLRVSCMK